MTKSELLVIGGASGVGKSTAAFALHDLLSAQDVRHAVVEGDALDLAYPAPWSSGLAFRNLSATWANYRALDYHRLIFTNTVSVLEASTIADAMGSKPRVTAVLLQATTRTIHDRLSAREQGEVWRLMQKRAGQLPYDSTLRPARRYIGSTPRSEPHTR